MHVLPHPSQFRRLLLLHIQQDEQFVMEVIEKHKEKFKQWNAYDIIPCQLIWELTYKIAKDIKINTNEILILTISTNNESAIQKYSNTNN